MPAASTAPLSRSDSAKEPHIAVHDLYKALGGQPVLKGVNLEIHRGESLVVLGQSGEGKSVFLKHLIGLIKNGGAQA